MSQQPRRTHKADVMISSTTQDLSAHREATIDAVWRARMYALAMESEAAKAHVDAISFSMKMVDEAEVYIGIFGLRYGYIPDDAVRNPKHLSITELEYWRAVERDIPILIFIMGDDHPISAKDKASEENSESRQKLQALKTVMETKHFVGYFNSVEDLRTQVISGAPDAHSRRHRQYCL